MSGKRVTLDANVLVYAFDAAESVKRLQALEAIEAAAKIDCLLALQAVGEFFTASVRRKILSATDAAKEAEHFFDIYETFSDSETAHRAAAEATAKGRFSYWDAVLLSSASEQGCEIILSEDMHDGAKLGNIVVRNPFGANGLSDAAKAALGV